MNVTVRIPNQLRDLVGGAAAVEVDVGAVGDGSTTVAAVLDAVGRAHPPLERRVRDERGQARQHVNVFVGADNVRDRDGLATAVLPTEEVTILPAVSGG